MDSATQWGAASPVRRNGVGGYRIGFWVTWVLVFLGAWAYAIATYGWFLGLALGWIPAAIIGALAGAVWPLWVLLIGGGILFMVYG